MQFLFSDRRACVVYQNHKVVPFESIEVFRRDPFLALYFSLSSLTILRLLCLLPSAALFTLTMWPFGPPLPRSPLQWRPHKELCFDWNAGLSTGVFLSITRSCFLLLVRGRLFLLALPFLLGICLPLQWNRLFSSHALALIPLNRQGAALAHLDFILPHDLVLWTDGSVSSPFGKGGSAVLANCFLCGTEATFFFFSRPSKFKFLC